MAELKEPSNFLDDLANAEAEEFAAHEMEFDAGRRWLSSWTLCAPNAMN